MRVPAGQPRACLLSLTPTTAVVGVPRQQLRLWMHLIGLFYACYSEGYRIHGGRDVIGFGVRFPLSFLQLCAFHKGFLVVMNTKLLKNIVHIDLNRLFVNTYPLAATAYQHALILLLAAVISSK
ncbi:hypothetical protein F4801DRAFT_57640 [Xylaria longipes]|nr:hypothetical protein F4801DRAFT_57640 [Xylaria longipes]